MAEKTVHPKYFHVESSWGVGTFRQTAGYPSLDAHKYHYDCPLGASIVRWDIENQKRLLSFQAHSEMITSMIRHPNQDIGLTVSYNGEVKLWNKFYKNSIYSFQLPTSNTVFAIWSPDGRYFGCCSKGPTAMLIIYEVEITGEANNVDVKLLWLKRCRELENELPDEKLADACNPSNLTKLARMETGIYTSNDLQSEPPKSSTQVKTYDCYDSFLFLDNGKAIAVLEKKKAPCEAHLFTSSGEITSKKQISPLGDPETTQLCTSSSHKGVFAVGLQSGLFVFMDSETLDIKSVIQATGSPQVCTWDGDLLLVVSYLSGVISWLSRDGKIIKECKGGPKGSIVHLNWSIPGEELWVGGIMSLYYVCLPECHSKMQDTASNPIRAQEGNEISNLNSRHCGDAVVKFTLSKLELTGCGLDVSTDGRIASGDFVGNVFIWKKGNDSSLEHLIGQGSIRSLLWCGSLLFVGTLDGALTVWGPKTSKPDEFEICATHGFKTGVVTMRKAHTMDKVAVGLASGELYIFSYKRISDTGHHSVALKQEFHIVAHKPKKRDMEIWSVCWNPNDAMVATSSEDQTTCILDLKTGMIMHYIAV